MQLHRLSMEGKWGEMIELISDDMLEEFAVVGTFDEIIPKIRERFSGVATTLNFGYTTIAADDEERQRWFVDEVKKL
jgi:hypothetical protein